MKANPQDGKKPRKPRKPKDLCSVPVGPPLKFTPAQFIEAYIKCGCSVTHAALMIGCSRDLHYIWLRENPEYPAMVDRAREIFNDRAEYIANDCMGAYEDINALREELMADPETGPTPDDTPEIKRQKKNHRRALLNAAQDFNKYAIDMSKHVHKLRGSKRGWRDKVETEISVGPSLADMINKGTLSLPIIPIAQKPIQAGSDGIANILGD